MTQINTQKIQDSKKYLLNILIEIFKSHHFSRDVQILTLLSADILFNIP